MQNKTQKQTKTRVFVSLYFNATTLNNNIYIYVYSGTHVGILAGTVPTRVEVGDAVTNRSCHLIPDEQNEQNEKGGEKREKYSEKLIK